MLVKTELIRKIPGAKIACVVGKTHYVLNHRFAHRDDPKLYSTLMKIRDAGQINTTHWHVARKGEI